MNVEHYTTRNDANHDNKHAKVNGIEFVAMPFQPYLASVTNVTAKVYHHPKTDVEVGMVLYKGLPNGSNEVIFQGEFKSLDDAFISASMKLNGHRYIPYGDLK